jgi:hypothetical protein
VSVDPRLFIEVAQQIGQIHGHCLVASQFAIIGAASKSYAFRQDRVSAASDGFGPSADYVHLASLIYAHRNESSWWSTVFHQYSDPLSRATWALSLLTVSFYEPILACLHLVDSMVRELPKFDLQALLVISSQLGANDVGRKLPRQILPLISDYHPTAIALIVHHIASTTDFDRLPELRYETLIKVAIHLG